MYKSAGFDGYLTKPVEPDRLEEKLAAVLPKDLIHNEGTDNDESENVDQIRRAGRKRALIITTDSVCDLPPRLLQSFKVPVLSYKVYTDTGIFTDGYEAEGDVMVRYMADSGRTARSRAPEVSDYENFFAEQLSYSQRIIHITMARGSSNGYANACEAARSFANVKVFDSGHLSSGMGLMVLTAAKMVDSGQTDPDVITDALIKKRDRISTSFIVESTDYLYRGGRMSERINRLCTSLMIHPVISLKDSNMRISSIVIGGKERTRRQYMKRAFRDVGNIDRSILFITYAGMKKAELEEIKKEVSKTIIFDSVCFQKASPAISINCGPGTFGLIFARK